MIIYAYFIHTVHFKVRMLVLSNRACTPEEVYAHLAGSAPLESVLDFRSLTTFVDAFRCHGAMVVPDPRPSRQAGIHTTLQLGRGGFWLLAERGLSEWVRSFEQFDGVEITTLASPPVTVYPAKAA